MGPGNFRGEWAYVRDNVAANMGRIRYTSKVFSDSVPKRAPDIPHK